MKKADPRKTKTAEIVSIVSHQFKTPLAVIKGYLEALISEDCGEINASQGEYLSDALENVKRMSCLVENLLDISRIEEGQFKLKLKPVALDKTTEQVLKGLSTWTKANNCDIVLKKPERLPRVLADPDKIFQVVQDLITNAVIYKTGRGKTEITLKKVNKEILFICKDNGVGIPKRDFNRIFSKFYRSGDATELNPSGSGLGLYITEAIIELSKGKIWFTKNKKRGMTVTFSLPVTK
ncbi:MAG TPA: HAMP domain-containing sensor histidine kinase [Candidatus Humimicrobiaceae bacterium]|nr:HAMP domain-containing sensor histidine kinase [Candidatus Humimicrobiaceae bacterium]